MQLSDETTVSSLVQGVDEEAINTLTHGIGLALSLAGAVAIGFITRSADIGMAIACGVYAVTLIAVYLFSTLSHAVRQPRARHLLRTWDQGTIYLLIVGTYTPFIWQYLPSPYRWAMLAAVWGIALVGFISKVVVHHRVDAVSALSYVLLGWFPALALINQVSLACLTWMAVGGLLYTGGTLFLALDTRYRYFHAAWHVSVILGSALHYYAILTFVVPGTTG